MSVPQSNSTYTIDKLIALPLRTRRTPDRPLTAVSIGSVTFCSTSSADSPPASVRITTVGAFSSGNTSTGMRGTWYADRATTATARSSTSAGFLSENAISRLSISGQPYLSGSACQVPSAWKWPPPVALPPPASFNSYAPSSTTSSPAFTPDLTTTHLPSPVPRSASTRITLSGSVGSLR